jgi:hypothetical protein
MTHILISVYDLRPILGRGKDNAQREDGENPRRGTFVPPPEETSCR